jgi:Ca2+/Na+ antiporter
MMMMMVVMMLMVMLLLLLLLMMMRMMMLLLLLLLLMMMMMILLPQAELAREASEAKAQQLQKDVNKLRQEMAAREERWSTSRKQLEDHVSALKARKCCVGHGCHRRNPCLHIVMILSSSTTTTTTTTTTSIVTTIPIKVH